MEIPIQIAVTAAGAVLGFGIAYLLTAGSISTSLCGGVLLSAAFAGFYSAFFTHK
ncbi:hypothetical protein [Pseudomonas syringae pv. coryli]|uniref:hypothetical protein n=1 Tax=Pseudomonas syringae pv. coryli TaxID=317659 RepID=UPI003D297978